METGFLHAKGNFPGADNPSDESGPDSFRQEHFRITRRSYRRLDDVEIHRISEDGERKQQRVVSTQLVCTTVE